MGIQQHKITIFAISGIIVQRATRKTLAEYASETIFRPLGMAHTPRSTMMHPSSCPNVWWPPTTIIVRMVGSSLIGPRLTRSWGWRTDDHGRSESAAMGQQFLFESGWAKGYSSCGSWRLWVL